MSSKEFINNIVFNVDFDVESEAAAAAYIGLWGSCGEDQVNWRIALRTLLNEAKVDFYDPNITIHTHKREWQNSDIAEEALARENSTVNFMYITADTRGTASIIEAIDMIINSSKPLVLIIEDFEADNIAGENVTRGDAYMMNLLRMDLRQLARSYGVNVFSQLDNEVVNHLASVINNPTVRANDFDQTATRTDRIEISGGATVVIRQCINLLIHIFANPNMKFDVAIDQDLVSKWGSSQLGIGEMTPRKLKDYKRAITYTLDYLKSDKLKNRVNLVSPEA